MSGPLTHRLLFVLDVGGRLLSGYGWEVEQEALSTHVYYGWQETDVVSVAATTISELIGRLQTL